MLKSFFCLVIVVFSSCSFSQQKNAFLPINSTNKIELREINYEFIFDSTKCGLNFKKGANYNESKNKISLLRNNLRKSYLKIIDFTEKSSFLDSVSLVFSDNLLNEIIPYWYGTYYDFSGYTSIPNRGSVGCSYFVSTTFEAMGLNVNRYKLAQQNPENEALSIAISDANLEIFYDTTGNDLNLILEKLDEGLYFVGLDCHVGYLYKHNDIAYFIHANYIEGCVNIELAEISQAFGSSVYYFSKISTNQELAQKWIMNEPIEIITHD